MWLFQGMTIDYQELHKTFVTFTIILIIIVIIIIMY